LLDALLVDIHDGDDIGARFLGNPGAFDTVDHPAQTLENRKDWKEMRINRIATKPDDEVNLFERNFSMNL